MKSRLSLALVMIATGLLASCASKPDRAPHATAAMLDLKQPSGFLGVHWKPAKRRPVLVARRLDGRGVADPSLPAGLAMAPGPHTVTLSVTRNALTAIQQKLGLDRNLDSGVHSRHDRDLSFVAIGGHDYVANMKPKGESFHYWIEDDATGKIVADTRPR